MRKGSFVCSSVRCNSLTIKKKKKEYYPAIQLKSVGVIDGWQVRVQYSPVLTDRNMWTFILLTEQSRVFREFFS